jgi:putative ABC transport system ATP-binding protein
VGVVFQSFHLIPTMTALENVALPMELAGTADALTAPRPNWPMSGWRTG